MDKKKLIADILTFIRLALGIGILFLIFLGSPALSVLILFALGLATDALDGIAARKWPYTEDDLTRLPRFWQKIRANPKLFDALTDGVLFYSALLFVLGRAYYREISEWYPTFSPPLPVMIFCMLLFIGVCGTWQVQSNRGKLIYRWFFIIELSAVLLALTYAALPPDIAKAVVSAVYLPAALALLYVKKDRWQKV